MQYDAAMRATLRDSSSQQRLVEDGYVVVDLLDGEALASLTELWDEVGAGLTGFHSTIHSDSVAHKRRVDEQLRSILTPRVEGRFDRHRCVIANFVAKAPGDGSEMPEHLDWTMVADPDLISVGVWAPLVDTDRANGGLSVIRGSHRDLLAISGTPHFPSFDEMRSISHRFADEDRIELDLRAGQAVIYDHRVVHYSPANRSDAERVAVNVAVVPREARLFHHHLHPSGSVERFQVDDSFYVTHDIHEVPDSGLSQGLIAREFACLRPEPAAAAAAPRATFKDPELQAAFARDGYVRIPLISAEQVAELRATWEEISNRHGSGFHATMYSDDPAFKAAIDGPVRAILGPALERWLDGHTAFVGNFVVKDPGPASEVGPHQDWTFVDESRYTTAIAWCPLIDTDDGNGTLRVVPGSHRWIENPRGAPIDAFPFPYEGLREQLRERDSVPIAVRAGEAIISDHRLVHSSLPNMSDEVRMVAGCGVAPSEAPLRHLFFVADGVADVYAADDPQFFNELVPGRRPEAEPIERIEFESVAVTAAQLDRWLGRRWPATEPAPEVTAEPAAPAAELNGYGGQAHRPAHEPTFRRRAWNLLSWDQRNRIHAAWRRLPDPVRRTLDIRRGAPTP